MLKLRHWGIIMLMAVPTGCQKQKPTVVPAAPPVVSVSQPIQKEVTDSAEYTGYTTADKSVDLRSQVRGYLESTHFKPRDRVKTGDLLFQIDPRPFQAEVDKAKADLEVAKALFNLAEAKLTRMEESFKAKAISEVQVIEQRAERDRAKADIDKAKALLDTAQLNLEYTRITAPVDGLMGRDLPGKGDLIEPQQTLMATITDDRVVYAYFNFSETDLLRLREAARKAGEKMGDKPPAWPIHLGMANETGYPHTGAIDYVAPQVDRTTGTIEIRGRFENPNRVLLAGLFVRIQVPVGKPKEALVIAERAIGLDQGQRFVLVLDEKNIVDYRRVTMGKLDQGMRVIESGLKPDESVIVSGLQRVRPGVQVSPHRVEMTSFSEASAASASHSGSAPAAATQPGK